MNVIHLYLDENELRPDNREDLRPNGFTPAKTFHDFPIRGQEVLLHVRRRRWLDSDNHNVMIVSACFPKAMITLDRFHHQQFCLEALQELRIGHRREVMTEVANARDDFRAMIKDLIKSGKPLVDAEGKPIRSNAA